MRAYAPPPDRPAPVASIERATGEKPRLRGDSSFVSATTLDDFETDDVEYVFRVTNNQVLDRIAEPYLVRPAGRRPKEPREWVYDLEYQAGTWTHGDNVFPAK